MHDDPATPLDRISFLARAESRVRLLEYLLASGSATRSDLRTTLDASRTTVARSLQSLTDEGWVERDGSGYRLTRAGRIVASEFTATLETFRAVDDLSEFLRWFPAEVASPAFHDVGEYEVTTVTDADPYAPARKQAEILTTAERLRILLPGIDLDSTETIVEEVVDRGLTVETIVSPDVESTLESDAFAPLIREKVDTGRSAVFVAETDLPFYLGLADDGRVQIGVEDDEGLPRALLETTDDDVREWAEDVYRDHRERARRKPVDDLD